MTTDDTIIRGGENIAPAEVEDVLLRLRDYTRRALRSSKAPDRFWFLDELPRTETGKLLRRRVPDVIAEKVNP